MKILFTVEYYYPHLGGAESVVQNIAEAMAKKGHFVTVATSKLSTRNFQTHNGVKIKEFDIRGNQVKGMKGQKSLYENYLIRSDCDIIVNYAAQTWCTDITLKILKDIKAKKVIIPCGYSGLSIKSKRIPYYFYFKKLHRYLRQYQLIIYHTKAGNDHQYGEKYRIGHSTIIPNGVLISEFQNEFMDFKKKYGIHSKYLLVSIGNHFKIKNHKYMIRAIRNLDMDDFTFIIIGKEIDNGQCCYDKCKKLESKCGGKLRLFNNLSRNETVAALKQADLFLFSSKFEYFPIVLLEAMVTKTPFISTAVGNARELSGGRVVNSPKQMTDQIKRLLNDKKTLKKIGDLGYEQSMQNFSWEFIANQYEAIFEKLIGDNDHLNINIEYNSTASKA